MRGSVGYRSTLVAGRASEANRIAKVLEGGNIKIWSVVTDILGESSRNHREGWMKADPTFG